MRLSKANRRLTLTHLESREVPSYYLVLGSGDVSGLTPTGGTGSATHPFEIASLRSAIEQANASIGRNDTIRFEGSLLNQTISLDPELGPLTFVPGARTTIEGQDRGIHIDGGGADRFRRVVEVQPGASARILDLTVQNGIDGELLGGGGIRNSGTLTLTRVAVTGNRGLGNGIGGGGIFNSSGARLTLTSCVVADNTASRGSSELQNLVPGGGIENRGIATITSTTVRDNLATSFGGGIDNIGTLTIRNSTISGNDSGDPFASGGSASGGGIASSGKLTLTNLTISGNSAQLFGGGISSSGLGSANILSCTITENFAASGGGIHVAGLAAGNTFNLRNTIVSRNADELEHPNDIVGFQPGTEDLLPITANYCLIGASFGIIYSGRNNQFNVYDPGLGPLQDNGGETFTHALLFGSPAANMGDPSRSGLPATDQRGIGFARVSGGRIDIGAFELQVPPVGGGGGGSGEDLTGNRRYH